MYDISESTFFSVGRYVSGRHLFGSRNLSGRSDLVQLQLEISQPVLQLVYISP